MAGRVEMTFGNIINTLPQVRSGRLRAIAVSSLQRWPPIPYVPTVAESSYPGFEAVAWFGLLAPANTPKPIVDMLQKHVAAILKLPEVEKMFLEQGAEPVGDTPEQFAKVIASEMQKWAKVAAATGVKLD